MMLYVTNVRYRMVPTPATIGANVRTMGMKRASTMVLGPYLSKKPCAFTTLAGLKKRDLGRSKRDGPTFLPNQ